MNGAIRTRWTAFVGRWTTVMTMPFLLTAPLLIADGPALKLRASGTGAAAAASPITIELWRWSTDGERAPLLTALSAPSPALPAPAAGRAGRGVRGGRGPAPPPPSSPLTRLSAAVKTATTVGFIWSDGPTGYSIKYAWHTASADGQERIVLVIDRRLGANSPSWPQASAPAGDAEFTLMEMRIDGKGVGEAKTSLTSPVVIDAAAHTLALDAYADAPAWLKVAR